MEKNVWTHQTKWERNGDSWESERLLETHETNRDIWDSDRILETHEIIWGIMKFMSLRETNRLMRQLGMRLRETKETNGDSWDSERLLETHGQWGLMRLRETNGNSWDPETRPRERFRETTGDSETNDSWDWRLLETHEWDSPRLMGLRETVWDSERLMRILRERGLINGDWLR